MTAIETSPFTEAPGFLGWTGAPRYGLPTAVNHSFFLPVAADTPSRIRLKILGNHKIEIAACTAKVLSWPEMSDLPSFAAYYRAMDGVLP